MVGAMSVVQPTFTGRIVTVPNAKIFDDPVYNSTRDFPYWSAAAIASESGFSRKPFEAVAAHDVFPRG
jgi:hypothetical protein